MTRSEWICNTCEQGFETKRKRNAHRERMHRQKMITDTQEQEIRRSGNGKFICKCEKDYMWARSLRRHQRNCKTEILKEPRGYDNDDDEGIILLLKMLTVEVEETLVNIDEEMPDAERSISMPLTIDSLYNMIVCEKCGIELPFE